MVLKYSPIPIGLWGYYAFHKQHSFNKKLQKQKAELDKDIKYYDQRLTLLTEQVKFNHIRRNEDFKLWTIKRHEAYMDMHKYLTRLFYMFGELQLFLWGPVEILTMTSTNDVVNTLEKLDCNQNGINKIVTTWNTDKEQAKEMIELLMQKDLKKKMMEIASIINDKTVLWSLYLPINMRNILLNFYLQVEESFRENDKQLWRTTKNEVLERRIKQLLEECKEIMNKMVTDLSGELSNNS